MHTNAGFSCLGPVTPLSAPRTALGVVQKRGHGARMAGKLRNQAHLDALGLKRGYEAVAGAIWRDDRRSSHRRSA
jgi:hypothetical protein